MTINQLIMFCLGALIVIAIVFYVLKMICLLFLEKKRQKVFLKIKPNAEPKEIDDDFQVYFSKFKNKFYIILGIVSVVIYILVYKR